MIWWHISALLCSHGFFKEYRPNEPFISRYLVQWKNFTSQEVYQEVYPLGTYITLCLLILIFLLTDYLRYKTVIVVGGLCGVVCWSLIRWGTTLPQIQASQFFYAFFEASEVAYYTYIYAKVDQKYYQRVTSHTRAAYLLGKAGAGLSAQLFATYNVLDYEQLNYLTIAGLVMATISAALLPSVGTSMYFHRKVTDEKANLGTAEDGNGGDVGAGNGEIHAISGHTKLTVKNRFKLAYHYLYTDFIHAYTNPYVLRWSLWWALGTCGYFQISSYAQLLWEEINLGKEDELLNGYVEFGYSLIGAFVAFAVGYLHLPWASVGELFLAVVSLAQGGLMIYSAYLDNLIVAYCVYMAFGLLYQSAITIAASEVAQNIREDSYALVFGVNFFVALVGQTIITTVVIEGLKIGIRDQFVAYGGYYMLIGVGFIIAAIVSYFLKRNDKSS